MMQERINRPQEGRPVQKREAGVEMAHVRLDENPHEIGFGEVETGDGEREIVLLLPLRAEQGNAVSVGHVIGESDSLGLNNPT
jgi:hypothetical protein